MPCPHNEITIVQRSQRQSAVAAAAYQSGEKLFCEYDQQVKHYPEKRGIVHNEILLPANAPQEYADRNTLWNAAEAVEKQWNSQLARRWVLTIPREIPPDQYAVLVREFCQQQFVSKGMIADFAIHDPHPPGHNPHAHVLLTMRAMDEHGKWLPKSRKVYDLDENGERIKLPSGRWKSHKEDTVDWKGVSIDEAVKMRTDAVLQEAVVPITVSVRPIEPQGKLIGFASVNFGGVVIDDFKVVDGKNGIFLGAPSKPDPASRTGYRATVRIPDRTTQERINAAGVEAYHAAVEQLVARAQAVRPTPIKEQMAEAAKQAGKENAARPAPAKAKEARNDR